MLNPFWIDVIGSLAACLTTVCFLPQAWHSFRTRDVSGVGSVALSIFCFSDTPGVAYSQG